MRRFAICILLTILVICLGGAGGLQASSRTSTAASLSAGMSETCYAKGQVFCWGNNTYGQLGNDTTTSSPVPVLVQGITQASRVSVGGNHVCALVQGQVFCWGRNDSGQLGNGTKADSSIPVAMSGISDATQVAAGGSFVADFSCVLRINRTVWCAGSNRDGSLGNGTGASSSILVRVRGITDAVQISAGLRHMCARLSNGQVKCWGLNMTGELGNARTHNSSVPVVVKSILTARSIAVGGEQTCALLKGGKIKCWGADENGKQWNRKLGAKRLLPVALKAPLLTKISAGGDTVCAIDRHGAAWCAGDNDSAQLGQGKLFDSLTKSYRFLRVKHLSGAQAISVGDEQACALQGVGANARVKCWGDNSYGQLGNGMQAIRSTPVTVRGITKARQVDTENASTCAVLQDGTVSCWGANGGERLGLSPKVTADRTTPIHIKGIAGAIQVSGADSHACALLKSGRVRCWGRNKSGELGNGTRTGGPSPVYVKNLTGTVQLSGGSEFTCALLRNGLVKCWGANYASQLGNGNTPHRSLVPTRVKGIGGAVSISSNYETTCATLQNGTVKCWGSYDPTDPMANTGNETATAMTGIVQATQTSETSECALSQDKTVSCWGDPLNLNEEENGAIYNITGIAQATQISGFCTRNTDGTVSCWGDSYYGQLGNGDTSFLGSGYTAVTVSGITTATSVSGTSQDSCAVLQDGTISCWGNNYWGQLGNGERGYSAVPVAVIDLP